MSKESLLPAGLTLLISRPDAQKRLGEVIDEGKRLLRRRSPKNLQENSPRARELVAELKAWGARSITAMNTALGENAAAAARSIRLGYVTLDGAKARLRLRLDLLEEALTRTQSMRKTTATTKEPPKGRSPATSKPEAPPASKPKGSRRHYKYDFCLSFAGEDRKYVANLVKLLQKRGASIFYDDEESHRLWGESLIPLLSDIYQNRCRFCIIFVSAAYLEKMWPGVELEAAQARRLLQPSYILPVKIDDTELPGIPSSRGFRDSREHRPAEIADAAVKKLDAARRKPVKATRPAKTATGARPPRSRVAAKKGSARLVMLGDQFYREAEIHQSGDTLAFTVNPRNDTERANLQELSDSTRASDSNRLSFSSRIGSGRGSVQNVETSVKGKQSQVTVTLQSEPSYMRLASMTQVASPLLERQARWVLFGELPPQHERYLTTSLDTKTQAFLDAGVVKKLWEEWSHTKAEFVEGAWLLLRFLLQELAILDGVISLDVGPWKKQTLPIKLKGTKRSAFSANDVDVAIEGELELPMSLRQH